MSESRSQLLRLPAYGPEDLKAPLKWLERLPFDDLATWLRKAIYLENPRPLLVPRSTRMASHLGRVFRSGSPLLRAQLTLVLPLLIQEWSTANGVRPLEDLLVLCGALRCSAAQDIIADTARHRLKGLPEADEVALRQRCLSVLAGIARGPRMRYVFQGYLDQLPYAATCYRALYLMHLPDAAKELPRLMDVYRDAEALDDLVRVLRLFFFYELRDRPRDLQRIAQQILKSAPEDTLRGLLDVIHRAGYAVEPNLRHSEPESVYLRNLRSGDPLEFGIGPIPIEDLSDERVAILLESAEGEFLDYLHGIIADPSTWEER